MSATIRSPEQRAIGRLGSRRSRRRLAPWLLLALALAAGGGFWAWQLTHADTATVTTTTATVSYGALSVSVAGGGTVAAAQSRALSFPVSGTVAEVLVAVGDAVSAGQPLARLATTDLELALRQAEANLKSAEAALAAANGAGATPEELASAEASLRSAQAQYSQTVNGTATAADIASARAQLQSAQAQLAELLAGPTSDTLASAQARVEQARLTLQSQRASLSAAKTRAEGDVTTAANNLRDAQDAYSTIYWQNRQREKAPGELDQSAKDEEAAAERSVQNAEATLRQAQLAYEQARQDEVIGIQQAESDLRDAEEQLRALQAGPTAAEVASARASVASARANLDALTQGATAEERAIAQASLEQAQISLEQLSAPASASSVASAEAGLAQAQVAYEQAVADLDEATLRAPFAGVVAAVALSPGDAAGSEGTITIINPSDLYVELSLSESDVAGVAVGQPVGLTFDALPDLTIEGVVESVAPTATVTSNVATYPVRVGFDPGTSGVRSGMTASGAIVTEERADALLVPSRAIVARGDAELLMVQQAEGQPATPVRVETGLSSDGQTEILSCVDTGDLCLAAGDTLLITTTSGTASTTGATSQGGGLGGLGGLTGGPPPGGFSGGRP